MAAPAHLQLAAAQFPQFHFQRSVVTSTNLSNPSYVTLLASYPLPAPAQEALSATRTLPQQIARAESRHNLLAAVSSERTIKLYNYSLATQPGRQATLEHFSELRGHTGAIHDIKFHNVHGSYDTAVVESSPNGVCMLTSCSQDGTVRCWDVRQQQAAMVLKHPKNKPFFACASAGNLLAASSGPFVHLWDLRSSTQLAENEEFHTEDINQIAFHPLNPGTFFTGAEDGLICEIKPEDPDQDEWLQNVINIENPLSRFGFFGPGAEYVWALSCVETLSLWHIERCERISDFSQIRDHLSRAANMPIDYLIDAHYDQKSERVFLATGRNSGELVLSHVNRTEIQPFCLGHVNNKPQPGQPSMNGPSSSSSSSSASFVSPVTGFSLQPLTETPFEMSALTAIGSDDSNMEGTESTEPIEEGADFLKDGEVIMNNPDSEMAESPSTGPPINPTDEGHTATIRDVLWFENVLITAGEDSRLCIWSTDATAAPQVSSASELKVKQHSVRAKPGAQQTPAAASSSASPPAPQNSAKNNRQYSPY